MHILGQLGPCKHAQGETLQCRPQHACPEERFAPYHEQCALSLQGLGSQCRCRVMSISLLRWRMWCRGASAAPDDDEDSVEGLDDFEDILVCGRLSSIDAPELSTTEHLN